MRDSMLPACLMVGVLITATFINAGCSRKKEPETEEASSVISLETVITEPETEFVETQTEEAEELRTKDMALENFTRPQSVSGTVSYSIRGSSETNNTEGYAVTQDDVFVMKNTNGVVDLYMSDEEGYFLGENGWTAMDRTGGSLLLFNPQTQGVYYKGTQDNNGIKTDVLETISDGSVPAVVMAILEKNGKYDIDPYKTTVNWTLSDGVLDAVYFNVEFMDGTGGGTLTVKFNVDSAEDGSIALPDLNKITRMAEYSGGSVEDGLYTNEAFHTRIKTDDVLVFDESKTSEMNAVYTQRGAFYVSDAYASCEGGILNVTYIPEIGDTDINILDKYLKDCLAENISPASQGTLGGDPVVYADSEISGTKARTFCKVSDNGALVFCVYYKDEGVLNKVIDSFIRYDADPNWKEETKKVGPCMITTPDQYKVDNEVSSELYTCFISPDGSELNIFVLDGTVEKVLGNDTAEGSVVKQETVTSEGGKTAQYLEISGSQDGIDYTAYELLWQGSPEYTVKYAVYSPNGEEEHLEEFLTALDLTKMGEMETETEVSAPDAENPAE